MRPARFIKLLPLLLLFFPALASADDLADRLNAKTNEVNGITKQLKDLDSDAGQLLATEKARLLNTDELLKDGEKSLKTKNDAYEKRLAAYNTQKRIYYDNVVLPQNKKTEGYNSRCHRTFTKDELAVFAACNQEKAQLDSEISGHSGEIARLDAISDSLRQQREGLLENYHILQERRKDLSQATIDWAAKVKKYNADRSDLFVSYNHALEELKQLGSAYSQCAALLSNQATDEEIKHRCGNVQFDNVRKNLEALKEIKPVWSVTPNQ